ncbi:MAG: DNA gyrase/topoisomerase IV subunit A [Verrucomicrobiota bacterium]
MTVPAGDSPDHSSLGDMYSDYFLDYASYVILERAVPHLADGLKPVQRRILHAMRQMDDGRYNKVANIVGDTMKYHPHGDQAIGDALVQLGQKELLIDPQGNWGNTLTGDRAAAPRYIEARLTKLALEVAFNPKTTEWTPSYDGRRDEPVTLPMKFPLLLAQGVEGIAVGLACKILPHNFIELCEACVSALRKEPFELWPDFPTGGRMDASDYREGLRGGRVRVRAHIEIEKARLLHITSLPFGVTTESLQASIVSAAEKGKIKISKVEDRTAAGVSIYVHLPAGTSAEPMRDALYAFTDCEASLSPNACVIAGGKPQFLGVHEIVRQTAEQTRELLRRELEIRLQELSDKWHFSSLEKIFIENKIYREIEDCETWEAVLRAIDEGLQPFKKRLKREVVEEDLIRLTEIKIKRISKFDAFRADEEIRSLEEALAATEKHLRQLTRYTVRWFEGLKKKFGPGRERKTEITTFEKVDRSQVAVATETLYLDRKNGFAGTTLRKEETIAKCSRLDDVLVISRDGLLKVTKVSEKFFVGKNPGHIAIWRKEDDPVFSLLYRDGRDGATFAKRFRVGGVTRDKEYPLTQGKSGTRILYLAVHASEEESNDNLVMVHMKAGQRLRQTERPFLWGEQAIKGRASKGNILTKHAVDRVVRPPKDFQLDFS